MFRPYIHVPQPLARRSLLRGAGVALGLPLLDAMRPAFAAAKPAPRRLFAICNNLGVLPGGFFPATVGRGYALSPYLEELREHRQEFTVFSGLSHPDVDGSHASEVCFLTAAPHPGQRRVPQLHLTRSVPGRPDRH